MSVQVYDKNGQPYEADLIDGIKYRELEKLLAAAKKDTDLLTWFEDWGYKDGIGWVLALPDNQYGQTRDIRAAIDAARKARP